MFTNTILKIVQSISPLPELYLDTNIWIELAKGNLRVEKINDWLNQNAGYVAFAKFQAAELSKSPQLVDRLADVIAQLKVVMVERWDQDIQGLRRSQIVQDPKGFMELDLVNNANRAAFVDEMRNGPIVQAQQNLELDAKAFRDTFVSILINARHSYHPSWHYFDGFLKSAIAGRCHASKVEVHPRAIDDPDRYSGIKLQYAIAFVRYFLHGKTWQASDYLDLMHCIDMAYAHTIVSERSLAEQILQVKAKKPGFCPKFVENIGFLR